MKKLIALFLVLVLSLSVFVGCSDDNTDKSSENSKGPRPTGATVDVEIKNELLYYANIEIKDYGTIIVELDQWQAPITVENFVELAMSGFYDGLTFHRIISNFMIQGGDPDADGTGGSDKTIKGEFISNGVNNTIKHERGVISMARSQKNDSASSQFFIMHKTSPHLDGSYAAFGYVTEGMEIVDKICASAKPLDSNGTIAFSKQPVITKITITTKDRPMESSEEDSEESSESVEVTE